MVAARVRHMASVLRLRRKLRRICVALKSTPSRVVEASELSVWYRLVFCNVTRRPTDRRYFLTIMEKE